MPTPNSTPGTPEPATQSSQPCLFRLQQAQAHTPVNPKAPSTKDKEPGPPTTELPSPAPPATKPASPPSKATVSDDDLKKVCVFCVCVCVLCVCQILGKAPPSLQDNGSEALLSTPQSLKIKPSTLSPFRQIPSLTPFFPQPKAQTVSCQALKPQALIPNANTGYS
jgi:hypothetical protein